MAPDFHLLAHSHGVAFLDAATDWRSRVKLGGGADPRFGDTFQGWFGGTVPARPIELVLARPASPPRSIVAWVMPPGGAVGHLVEMVPGPDGAPQPRVNPAYVEVLREWRGHAPIVSMIRGNEHALTMLGRFPPYDFVDPEVPGFTRGVPVIDEALIERYVSPWTDMVFHPLALARREAGVPVLHVPPPPPREKAEGARHLEEMGEVVRQFGFVPESLRLKWYRRYCRQLRARLAAVGCDLLEAPREALTGAGLLREDFSEGLTHGNRRYGELVAAQVEAWIAGLPR